MKNWAGEHKALETKGFWFTFFVTIAISVGGIVETVPPMLIGSSIDPVPGVRPYSALELAGRDIYIKEGCSGCHSQMIRPFKWEAIRFSNHPDHKAVFSKAGEYVYDRPFLWGSKRTGPDLWRESTLRNESWHYMHFLDPQMKGKMKYTTMPAYPWLFQNFIDSDEVVRRMETLNYFGTYEGKYSHYLDQAAEELQGKREIDALVAYMMKLGRDGLEAPEM